MAPEKTKRTFVSESWIDPAGEAAFLQEMQEDARYLFVPKKFTPQEMIQYYFDEAFSTRQFQIMMFAFFLTFLTWIFGTMFYYCGGMYGTNWNDLSMAESVWQSWTLVMDPGTQADIIHFRNKIVGGIITLSGVIAAATLIAFVVDAVKCQLDMFRAGRTVVREVDHTVLIGWNDKSLMFIRQFAIARAPTGGGVIVVLVAGTKEFIEDNFNTMIDKRDLYKTKVVFRSGEPQSIASLQQVAVMHARAVVLMSVGDAASADATTLRILIALRVAGLKKDAYVVAEVRDSEMDMAIKLTGGDQLETIRSAELNARVSLAAVQQPGIMKPYDELFGFDGSEFYTRAFPESVGEKFGNLIGHFKSSILVGVKSNGTVVLCPDNHYTIKAGDELIAIAEEAEDYFFSKRPSEINPAHIYLEPYEDNPPTTQRILVCGWGDTLGRYLKMLNIIFNPGTEVHLFNRVLVEDRTQGLFDIGVVGDDTCNLALTHIVGEPTVWAQLKGLDIASYHVILVVSDDEEMRKGLTQSDSRNLAAILLLRNFADKRKKAGGPGSKHLEKIDGALLDVAAPIFCEILESSTQKLIEDHPYMSTACNVLASNKLIAKVLAMVSEERNVRSILDKMLDGQNEFKIIPSGLYVDPKENASFLVVMKRAQAFRHIVIGYQHREMINLTSINPKERLKSRSWTHANFVVLVNCELEAQRMKEIAALYDSSHPVDKGDAGGKRASTAAAGETRATPVAGTKDAIKAAMALAAKAPVGGGAIVAGSSFSGRPGGGRRGGGGNDDPSYQSDAQLIKELLSEDTGRDQPPPVHIAFTLSDTVGLGFRLGETAAAAGPLGNFPDPAAEGLVVSAVQEGGQAAEKGVEVGWAVVALDGKPLPGPEALFQAVTERRKQARDESFRRTFELTVSFVPKGGAMLLRTKVARLAAEVDRHRKAASDMSLLMSDMKAHYERKISLLAGKAMSREGPAPPHLLGRGPPGGTVLGAMGALQGQGGAVSQGPPAPRPLSNPAPPTLAVGPNRARLASALAFPADAGAQGSGGGGGQGAPRTSPGQSKGASPSRRSASEGRQLPGGSPPGGGGGGQYAM